MFEQKLRKLMHSIVKIRLELFVTLLLISMSIVSAVLTQLVSYTVYFTFSPHRPIGFKVINSTTHNGSFSINRAFISSYGGDTIILFLNVSNRANNRVKCIFKMYCSSEDSAYKLKKEDLNLTIFLDSRELNIKIVDDEGDECFSYSNEDLCIESDKIEFEPKEDHLMKLQLTTDPSIYPIDYNCFLQFEAI